MRSEEGGHGSVWGDEGLDGVSSISFQFVKMGTLRKDPQSMGKSGWEI